MVRRLRLGCLARALAPGGFAFGLMLLTVGAAAADVTLVAGGQPKAELVVAEGNRVAALAARELTAFVQRSTGASLTTVTVPTPGVPHVFLGAGAASAAAGVVPGDLQPEGFHLKTVGGDVHLVGDDSPGDPEHIDAGAPVRTGTLSGAYELLERVVGVRFFWHDELGTVVPKHTDLVVPELDVTQAPHWRYRMLPYSPEGQTVGLYGRRLRLGQASSYFLGHNWFKIVPADKYGQTHPEYFALVGGKRQTSYYLGDHGGQVCTTNPEVIELFVQAALSYFDQNPNANMLSICPNDGGGFCECDRCRALDAERWGAEEGNQPVLTDRMLTFYNAVAERVAQKYPTKRLGAYIYSYYRKPPVKVKPAANLTLFWAVNSAAYQGEGWERERGWLDQWSAIADDFYSYDITWYPEWCLGLPAPMTGLGLEKLRYLLSKPVRGAYLYAAPSYESLGPLPYVTAKLMWDPTADPAALIKDYYTGLYGPAAPDVKAWYDLLEARLRQLHIKGLDTQDPAVLNLANGHRETALILNAYGPVLKLADTFLAGAAAKPLDAAQKQRLGRVFDHARLLRATVTAYLGAEHLTHGAVVDAAEAQATRAAIDERAQAIACLGTYAPTLAKVLAELDKTEAAAITPASRGYQLAKQVKPAVVYATQAPREPAMDARVSDAWAAAAWRDLVDTRTGGAPRGPGRAALMTTPTALYLLVEGWDEDSNRLCATVTARNDERVFQDDHVELFLVAPDGSSYHHLAIGAGGALYTKRHPTAKADETAEWNPPVQGAVCVGPHGWNAELRLPLAALQPAPTPGETGWKVNVFRVRRGSAGTEESTALSPTFGGHHLPGTFAELRFGRPVVACAFVNGDLEGLSEAGFKRCFNPQVQGQASVELAEDGAYAGAGTIHVVVGPGKSLATVTLASPVQPGRSYRISFVHRNQDVQRNPELPPQSPTTRVIFADAQGKPTTPTSGYSWAGTPLALQPGQWRQYAHTFTTPPGTTQVVFAVFLTHPGDYRLDNFRIEPTD